MVGLFRSHGLLNLGHKEALFYIVPCHKEAGKSIFRISPKKASAFFGLAFRVALKVSANTVSRESYIDGGGG